MGVPRAEPYIWATWLTRLLVGEESCEWGAWFKAHHQSYDKVPDTFDQTKWQMEHTALLREIRERLEPHYTIFLEDQNRFRLPGKESSIVVGGKPDLIAIKGHHGLVCDAKTGQPGSRTMASEVSIIFEGHTVPLSVTTYIRNGS